MRGYLKTMGGGGRVSDDCWLFPALLFTKFKTTPFLKLFVGISWKRLGIFKVW